MDKNKNLKPPFQKSEIAKGSDRDASVNGRKGGIQSGVSRRRKKTIAETTMNALYKPVTDEAQLEAIRRSGMPVPSKPTYLDFLVASSIGKAIKKGEIDDLRKLMDIIGEEPPMINETDSDIAEDALSISLKELAEKGLEDD